MQRNGSTFDLYRSRIKICVLWLLGSVCLAQSPRATPINTAAARGRAQFAKTCAFCHGADATGGGEGPNLTLSAVVRHDKGGDAIGPVILEGRPAKGMPAIPLTPEQISDVAAFLHTRIAELDRRSAGRPPNTYGLEKLLTGNAEAGKAFFNGTGGCTRCHSTTGDLAGIAKRYPPVELQTRFLYSQNVPQQVTVRLPSGEEVKGTLVYTDAFSIALRDEDGWYRSWPRKNVTVQIEDRLAGHRELLDRYTQADMHNMFAYLETLK